MLTLVKNNAKNVFLDFICTTTFVTKSKETAKCSIQRKTHATNVWLDTLSKTMTASNLQKNVLRISTGTHMESVSMETHQTADFTIQPQGFVKIVKKDINLINIGTVFK